MTTGRQQFEELRQIWSVGLPRIVLWPFVTLADLPLSPSTDVFLSGLPGALLIVAAVYAWVISAGVAPEDASSPAEGGGAEGRRASRGKPAGSRQPFNLALEGRPETAILWKNLILVGRHVSLSTLLRVPLLLLPLAIVFVTGRRGGGGTLAFVAIVCLTLAGMVLLLGPHVARNDLRQDLTKLGVLKSWPVSGASIIRGELLAPAIVLSVGAWLLVLVGALAFQGLPVRPGTRAVALHAHMASYTAAAMVLAPALIVAQLVVQNGIAVLFPAWMTLGRSRVRGIEGIGQQMLTTWGGFLVAALFLAPPAAGAAIVMFAVYSATQTIGVLAPAAVLLALLVAQSLLVTGWLGRVLDRTDLAAVDPVE
jgi:hypothetical protein